MKLIMENWRKFVKEAAGDMDNDGDVDPRDVAKLAAQVAAENPRQFESSVYKREIYKRLNQSNKSRTDILMELLVATLTQPDADFMRDGFNHKTMAMNANEFGAMKYELCEDIPELCSELESITSEQFTYFVTDNPNILSRYLNRPSGPGSSDKYLNEQVNTRLIKRLQDFRETAARQNKWDLVDACHDLLEKDSRGISNFVRFGEELQSAFASSRPGEVINVAADAIRSCHKKLKADIDNDGIPDKRELSRQG